VARCRLGPSCGGCTRPYRWNRVHPGCASTSVSCAAQCQEKRGQFNPKRQRSPRQVPSRIPDDRWLLTQGCFSFHVADWDGPWLAMATAGPKVNAAAALIFRLKKCGISGARTMVFCLHKIRPHLTQVVDPVDAEARLVSPLLPERYMWGDFPWIIGRATNRVEHPLRPNP